METLKILDSLHEELKSFQTEIGSFYDQVKQLDKKVEILVKIVSFDSNYINELKVNFLTKEEQSLDWILDAENRRRKLLSEVIHGTLS